MFSKTFSTLALALLLLIISAAPSAIALLGPAPVNLGTAANYAILAKSGVSTVNPSAITGAVAVSPIAATGLTGFSLTVDSSGTFSTSAQVTGHLFAASYSAPTPSTLSVAIGDMGTAFNDAAGRVNPNFVNLANGAIGGLILLPGLYKWTGAVSASQDFTLSGVLPTDTWIFQVAGTFSIAAGKKAILLGLAPNKNIVWVVSGSVAAGAGSHLEGVILGKTDVTLVTGATLNGRILSQTAVTLQKATVVS